MEEDEEKQTIQITVTSGQGLPANILADRWTMSVQQLINEVSRQWNVVPDQINLTYRGVYIDATSLISSHIGPNVTKAEFGAVLLTLEEAIPVEVVNWQRPDKKLTIKIRRNCLWEEFSKEIQVQTSWSKPRKVYFVQPKTKRPFGPYTQTQSWGKSIPLSSLCIVDTEDIVITADNGQSILLPLSSPLSDAKCKLTKKERNNEFFAIDDRVLTESDLHEYQKMDVPEEVFVEIPHDLISHKIPTSRQTSPKHMEELKMLKEQYLALEQSLRSIMLSRMTKSSPDIEIIMNNIFFKQKEEK